MQHVQAGFGSKPAYAMHIGRMHKKKAKGIARATPLQPAYKTKWLARNIQPFRTTEDFDQLMKMMGIE